MKLLEPWFTDPAMEEEYRDAAYTLQVMGAGVQSEGRARGFTRGVAWWQGAR